jgi:manganese/zinc/iron transport system substrate-binding protein
MTNLFFSLKLLSYLLPPTFYLLFSLSPVFAQAKVVTTVAMIADVVENVAGECAEVTTLMGSGIDPHLYKASASDVRTLQGADVIFYAGYNLEGQLGEVLESLKKRKTVVAVSEAAITSDEVLRKQGQDATDPHIWMDVSMWARTVDVIAGTLALSIPECQDAPANAVVYKEQLAALHEWVKASIATIPAEQRILITAHDAFYYFGRTYDIQVEAVQGISTQSEASIEDIRSIVETVVTNNIPAIFVESSINPRTIEAVLQAVEDQGLRVILGGSLYSDAMGEDGTEDGTYIGMLYHNTKTITNALGGNALPLPEALYPWAEAWSEQ